MKNDNHILVIICIVSIFSIILIEGSDISPSPSLSREEVDEIYDEVKKAFGPDLDDAKEKFGPVSSWDLEQFEEAKDAFGPIPSFDEAKEALGPASSSMLEKAKEALGPISPSTIEDAKEALGPASSKVKDALGPASSEAKEALGPSSSGLIDKAREKLDSITSWITQSKEETSSDEAQEAHTPSTSPLDPYGVLDGAKQKFDSLLDSITEEKEQLSKSRVEETQKASSPVSSKVINEAQNRMGPTSSSAPDSSEGSDLSKIIDEAKSAASTQNKEEISSDSPSISVKAPKEQDPISTSDENGTSMISAPAPAPIMPSTLEEARDAIGSYSSKAMDAAKEKFSSISSYLSENKLQVSPDTDIKLHATPVYLDHDVALAVESLIKQAQSNAQLAMDQAKTLVSDPTIDPSGTGKCVQKCMANYESCNQKLNKAMEDLTARNVELLKDDISAVEVEIQACQKCFQENSKMQSMFKDLEEATIKATRECLNVLQNSG